MYGACHDRAIAPLTGRCPDGVSIAVHYTLQSRHITLQHCPYALIAIYTGPIDGDAVPMALDGSRRTMVRCA